MPRKPREDQGQPSLLEARGSTAPCVPAIREKVKAWRDGGYSRHFFAAIIYLVWFHLPFRTQAFQVCFAGSRSSSNLALSKPDCSSATSRMVLLV